MSFRPKRVVVTGGAGFIGCNLVRMLVDWEGVEVVNVDKLTYAGNMDSLSNLKNPGKHELVRIDICDRESLRRMFDVHRPDAVMHLAAESHVDRSIESPGEFINTNMVGTFAVLEESRNYWCNLKSEEKERFRFVGVSTDEVYGSLGETGLFTESTPYDPSSPYSASKAGADHLVRAYYRTYGLPTIVTNCSNNYGPYQFPEKLIPLMIANAVQGKPLPVYGKGKNVRDWVYVEDHARALWTVATTGKVGETYNIGGNQERKNIDVVHTICEEVEKLYPAAENEVLDGSYKELIKFVRDRPGHDFRYAIDSSKIERDLDWRPEETFETGMRKTVEWYLKNGDWVSRVMSGEYRDWIETNYGERL